MSTLSRFFLGSRATAPKSLELTLKSPEDKAYELGKYLADRYGFSMESLEVLEGFNKPHSQDLLREALEGATDASLQPATFQDKHFETPQSTAFRLLRAMLQNDRGPTDVLKREIAELKETMSGFAPDVEERYQSSLKKFRDPLVVTSSNPALQLAQAVRDKITLEIVSCAADTSAPKATRLLQGYRNKILAIFQQDLPGLHASSHTAPGMEALMEVANPTPPSRHSKLQSMIQALSLARFVRGTQDKGLSGAA